jgi:hypothetical protein
MKKIKRYKIFLFTSYIYPEWGGYTKLRVELFRVYTRWQQPYWNSVQIKSDKN